MSTPEPQELTLDGATCRLYRDAPSWNGQRTAAIGNFRCESASSGAALLAKAIALLRTEGFESAIGPMDGDTWHRYRLVSESDGTPPFLMEPISGPYDKTAFELSGFTPISNYVSTRAKLADAIGPGEPVHLEGVMVSAWDGRDPAALIGRLFEMSSASFSRNAFFKPITKSEFMRLYDPVLPLIDPHLVLFAHDAAGTLVGFLFGLPDHAGGDGPKRAILKTYASGRRGVGHVLADSFHRKARDLGFVEVIHALMLVENVSLQRSGRHAGQVFRRYALMGGSLA